MPGGRYRQINYLADAAIDCPNGGVSLLADNRCLYRERCRVGTRRNSDFRRNWNNVGREAHQGNGCLIGGRGVEQPYGGGKRAPANNRMGRDG